MRARLVSGERNVLGPGERAITFTSSSETALQNASERHKYHLQKNRQPEGCYLLKARFDGGRRASVAEAHV